MTEFSPVNVAEYLGWLAERQPETLAVALARAFSPGDSERWTYRDLNQISDCYAQGLTQFGLRAGMRTALLVKPSLPFFGLVFALFKIGAVPVVIDPGIGARRFGRCLREARPEAFIGIPTAHIARTLLGWGKPTLKLLVTVGKRWGWGGVTLSELISMTSSPAPAFPLAEVSASDTAAILFTSGSTGPPKGTLYTHGMFSAQVRLLKSTYGLEPGEIDLCTFPLFALFAPALGWTAIIPDMDFTRPGAVQPERIRTAIEQWRVTNLFGSPALLEQVAATGMRKEWHFPTLRRVITAGAPVRPSILEQFSKLLAPSAAIHTPYGATEALPVATIASHEILSETRKATAAGKGNCVGRIVAEMQARILRITDEPIPTMTDAVLAPPGQIGEIAVRGPVVSAGYDHRPVDNQLAKVTDAGTFWHRMGDLGYFDESGRLWFCGRKSQRVRTTAGDLYTLPCEGIFNEHPCVRRTALVGVRSGTDVVPVLCVELLPTARRFSRQKIAAELLHMGQQNEHTRSIKQFLFHPRFPVDIRHNAKIFREQLAQWAESKLR